MMSLSEMRVRVKASIWQAIAQSGVDVSAVPTADMDKLVVGITDAVLQEMNEMLGEIGGASDSVMPNQPVSGEDDDEAMLWEGRPFLSLRVHYKITSERVRLTEGLLGKEREDIELVRIQDVDHKQNLTERMLNIVDVYIRSHDPSHPEVVLQNVTNPMEVHEILRRAVLKARKKYNLSYREEM
jgi:hypothetical protein